MTRSPCAHHRRDRQLRSRRVAKDRRHPEPIDVRARVRLLRPVHQLGRRIQERPHRPGAGAAGRICGEDQIEVRQPWRPRRVEQDVRRLHVAVEQSLRVRPRQRVPDPQDDAKDVPGAQALVEHGLAQIPPGTNSITK